MLRRVDMIRNWELKGMREDQHADSVVELPRSAWRHDAA